MISQQYREGGGGFWGELGAGLIAYSGTAEGAAQLGLGFWIEWSGIKRYTHWRNNSQQNWQACIKSGWDRSRNISSFRNSISGKRIPKGYGIRIRP